MVRLKLIDAFVSTLEPNLVGHAQLRRRLAEEMRGHLEDSAERYRARGMSEVAAQRRAIEDFGPPEVVVGGWAESKGVGVPTTFTRYAGLAGVIGTVGLAASMIYQQISDPYSRGPFAEVSMAFLALFTISLVALYMRVRGKLLPLGRLGPRVAMAGFAVVYISIRAWFAPGALVGLIAIFVGLGAFFVGTMKSGVIPRGPLALWIGGVVISLAIAVTGMVVGFDAAIATPIIGLGALAAGWVWLGLHLWNEEAVDEPRELSAS